MEGDMSASLIFNTNAGGRGFKSLYRRHCLSVANKNRTVVGGTCGTPL